ncbi:ATP-dependent DNA helicase II subunit 1 [Vanrija pseudolonga]|uniref:ATP-dependent DNA helicase II subunit 1 n=1 Tax=Vanrija pseudolonga TaxID=143232 RepID=A0AAF0YCG3_9TREE|nr:ATP-dependent DNA helicase II subunit 1 [Vanrija pseudolonga]
MSSYYGDGARSAPAWDTLDAGYDDEVIDQSDYQFANRDHILFAIDGSESMHTPMPDERNSAGVIRGKSALHQALEAVVRSERNKVVTGPADSVGLLLYNLDPEKVPASPHGTYKPGTYVVQAVRQINPSDIKRLVKLLQTANEQYDEQEDSDEPTVEPPILRKTFPPCAPKNELNIADVLSTCNFLFRDGGTKLAGNKRVLIVTDNDDPPGSENRAPARTVCSDLEAYGVSIGPFFVSRTGHKFDPDKYWNDILGRDASDDIADQAADGLEMLSDMMCDLVIRQAPKRKQFSIPLKFGGREGDIVIGVSGYSLVSEQKKGQPKLVRMRGQTVEEVAIKTVYTSAETGGDLAENQITQAFQFGDESKVKNILEPNWWESDEHQRQQEIYAEELLKLERARRDRGDDGDEEMDDTVAAPDTLPNGRPRVVARTRLQFSDNEIKELRSLGIEPQIKILGFQSPESLRLEDNVKHSFFIYPDENMYTGSTRTFTALLQSCVKLNRHALALCRFRINSTPEMCALIPQEETFTKEGAQEDPPGFHVIVLPFIDDIRDPPKAYTDNLTATDDQTKEMEKLMRKLRFKSRKYVSDAYPNPALAYHQEQLQALAFEEDFDTEQFEDRALPKYKGIHTAAGAIMSKWKQLIDDDERSRIILATKGPVKRAVVEIDKDDLADVEGAWKKGSLDKLKVQELKDYAKFNKISLVNRSKKADIIDAIQDHLDSNPPGGAKKSKS